MLQNEIDELIKDYKQQVFMLNTKKFIQHCNKESQPTINQDKQVLIQCPENNKKLIELRI